MWLLAKVVIIDCDDRYDGCNDYYRAKIGNKYLTGKSFGAAYMDTKYFFFPSWKPNVWNSFCSIYTSQTKIFKIFVNNQLSFQIDNLVLEVKYAKANVILLNAYSYASNEYIYPFDGS